MTQEATTYICRKCGLLCDVRQDKTSAIYEFEPPMLSLCCNAAAEPVKGKKQLEEAT